VTLERWQEVEIGTLGGRLSGRSTSVALIWSGPHGSVLAEGSGIPARRA
jgi:hypothetical protein